MKRSIQLSKRTSWHLEHNEFAKLLESYKSNNVDYIDLTISNPTQCGFSFYSADLLTGFQNKDNLIYKPDAFGLESARHAVVKYYKSKGISVNCSDICLTSSTSEAYTYLFKLLTNAGDQILYPQPSYPLFQFLGDINDVDMVPYPLVLKEGEWQIDFTALRDAITDKTRVVLIVNPNNPTGSYIKPDEIETLNDICQDYGLCVLSDDVFNDFCVSGSPTTVIDKLDVPTFVLNGLSKVMGLPQMKLAWIVCNIKNELRNQMIGRLEIIADTYLSLNTPVQNALPGWLNQVSNIQSEMMQRIQENANYLQEISEDCGFDVITIEGGWSAVAQIKEEVEDFAYNLLKDQKVYVHPSYFYDFNDESFFVISLLTLPKDLKEGINRIHDYFQKGK